MNNHEIKTLKNAIKSHYEEKSLSPDQLAFLYEQQISKRADVEPSQNKIYTWLVNYFRPSYQLALCMSIVAVLSMLFIGSPFYPNGPTIQDLKAEIAYNHDQNLEVEIASASLDEINDYMTSLSFTLIESTQLNSNTWKLIGGRYCSINGRLAAQLKIQNREDDKTYNLYQGEIPSGLMLSSTSTPPIHFDGVKVSIWEENGLLMGLASD